MIKCAYFSATNTTKKVAFTFTKELSDLLNMEVTLHNFTTPIGRNDAITFDKGDIGILAMPTIAGRVPNLMLPYLKEMYGKGAYGIAIALFGNRSEDDCLMELTHLMEDCGITVIGGGAFVGEHSFSNTLGKGRPNDDDLKMVKDFARAIANKYLNKDFTTPQVSGCWPLRPYYTPRDRNNNPIDIRKVKPQTNDLCIDCKICVKLCPLGSIDYYDVTNIDKCMKCCACVKGCPYDAKYFSDSGYLYHKQELEELYSEPAKNHFYV